MRVRTINLFITVALLVSGWVARPAAGLAREVPRAELAAEALRRGEQLRRQWKLDAAEAAFNEAATIEPGVVEARLGLARIARAKLDYPRAIRLLEGVLERRRDSTGAFIEYGLTWLAAEEPQRARVYFDRALQVSATEADATIGLAGVDLLEGASERAEARLRALLGVAPGNSAAHSMLARVLIETDRISEAAAQARQAIALDPYDVEALYALAYAQSIGHNAGEARSLARRAVTLDPLNTAARRLLSQYVDGRAGYDQRVPEGARLCYQRGRRSKKQGDLIGALADLQEALGIEPRYYRALIALGDVWLRVGEYERAAEAARLALSVDPDGTLAHLELCWAYRGIHNRSRAAIGAADFAESFYKKPAPPAYAATREIFPDYPALTKRQQAVIDAAVGPLVSFIPALAHKRARHYLLAYDERPTDLRGFADVAKEMTFDGRYYESLRGVGGRLSASGIEYLEQAAQGGFNTIAHEFAHQVHIAAMGKREVAAIRRLYEQAVREKRTLDHYAAANEHEYFAQGYEALISERKRAGSGVTGRHTREELARRDPELYKFLLALTGAEKVGAGVRLGSR